MINNFDRCLEAVGQAISYGMNTQIEANPLIGLYVLLFPETNCWHLY